MKKVSRVATILLLVLFIAAAPVYASVSSHIYTTTSGIVRVASYANASVSSSSYVTGNYIHLENEIRVNGSAVTSNSTQCYSSSCSTSQISTIYDPDQTYSSLAFYAYVLNGVIKESGTSASYL